MLEPGLAFIRLTVIVFARYGAFASATRRYVARPRLLTWFCQEAAY